MAGPVIEAIKEQLKDSEVADEVVNDSPLFTNTDQRLVEQYADELGRRMPSGGGCCSAADVAQTMRDGEKYD